MKKGINARYVNWDADTGNAQPACEEMLQNDVRRKPSPPCLALSFNGCQNIGGSGTFHTSCTSITQLKINFTLSETLSRFHVPMSPTEMRNTSPRSKRRSLNSPEQSWQTITNGRLTMANSNFNLTSSGKSPTQSHATLRTGCQVEA